ncbi:MAG: HlyD family efflux transporter periplasmic adaptor subunit [Paraclostridium sp.]
MDITRTMVLDEEDINLKLKKRIILMNETLVKAEDDGIIKYDIDSDERYKIINYYLQLVIKCK